MSGPIKRVWNGDYASLLSYSLDSFFGMQLWRDQFFDEIGEDFAPRRGDLLTNDDRQGRNVAQAKRSLYRVVIGQTDDVELLALTGPMISFSAFRQSLEYWLCMCRSTLNGFGDSDRIIIFSNP